MKRNLLSISIICALLGFFLILFGSIAYYSTTKTGNVTSTTKKISFDVYSIGNIRWFEYNTGRVGHWYKLLKLDIN